MNKTIFLSVFCLMAGFTKVLVFLLSFFPLCVFAQKMDILRMDSLPVQGVLLNKGWKFQTGDNPEWAKPEFDDSAWNSIDPTKEIADLPEIFNAQIKWLRLDFEIPTQLPHPAGLAINQAGASEIYLNGRKIHTFGHFDTDSTKVRAYDPLENAILFPADSVGKYTLAVRYALQPNIRYTNIFGLTKNRLFSATMVVLHPMLEAQRIFLPYRIGMDVFMIGVTLMLFLLHLAFFIYNRSHKTHLLLVVYFLGLVLIRIFKMVGQNQHSVESRYVTLNISNCILGMVIVCLAMVIYQIARVRRDMFFYVLVVFQILYVAASCFSDASPLQTQLLLIGNFYSFFVLIRVVRKGLQMGIKGLWTVGVSIFMAIFGLVWISVAFLSLNHGFSPVGYNALKYGFSPYMIDLVFTISNIAIPAGLSLFMGIQGNETNKALSRQLIENEHLKNLAIQQEQEKQQFLETQNETLEKQVSERTAALNHSLETIKSTQAQLIQSEKLASLGELTAGIAHEIQNPLNFVNNFSDLSVGIAEDLKEELKRTDKDEGYIEELLTDLSSNQQKINHHGKRAAAIVTGMLQHARTSTGKKESTDLNALADEYLRLAYHGLRAKDPDFDATMVTDFDPSIGKVEVIPQDMGRVLLNLINNAFYAVHERAKASVGVASSLDNTTRAPYQPTVTVSTQKMNNQIIMRIKDNGTGIPEAVKAKIFQPFFTTKPAGQGTGLGLSLAYDIVTKGHGGTLEVGTKEGEGTVFVLQLPISHT